MSRLAFALLIAAILVVVFGAMWFAWRARQRRDASVSGSASAPSGAVLAAFPRVSYVSTTPVGQPFTRVAAPGLSYRGPAALTIRADGVTIEVAGEPAVHLASAQLRGAGAAGVRVGKAVERGGLGLLRWDSAGRSLESGFRFANQSEQRAFAAAIAAAALPQRPSGGDADHHSITQEDSR